MIISCIISLFSFNYPLLGRFNLYLAFMMILFVPEVVKLLSSNYQEMVVIKIILSLVFICLYLVDLPNNSCVPWAICE